MFRQGIMMAGVMALCVLQTTSVSPSGLLKAGLLSSETVSGVWSDSCPCRVPCPCWKTGKASANKCVNVQVYQAHSFGLQKENTLFVLVGVPKHPYGAPEDYSLYVDPHVTKDNLDQLKDLLASFYEIEIDKASKPAMK